MGMDGVEIIMEIEDRFGIEIPDEEWPEVATMRGLQRLVESHLDRGRRLQPVEGPCPSFAPFFAVRRALVALAEVEPGQIRPRAPLAELLPREGRRELWQQLQYRTAIALPELQLPKPVAWMTGLTGALAMLAIIGAVAQPVGVAAVMGAIVLGMVCLVPVWLLLQTMARPLAVCIPEDCRTVGAIVQCAGRWEYPEQREEPPLEYNSPRVWEELVEIVSEILSVPQSEIRPESHLIHDLKCD